MDEELKRHEQERKDWHAGFAGGLELSFRKYRHNLTYEREHPLSKEPLFVDFIVIRKDKSVVIDNAVGRFFRTYNIVEYKNPSDELNIDVVCKVIGYAAIYKSLGKTVDEISLDEVTISIFRSSRPVKLFKYLKDNGETLENPYPGVYYIKGLVKIPVQIIVTSELKGDDFKAIRILREHADEEDALKFIEEARTYTEQVDKINANAVLRLFRLANKALIIKKRGENGMYSRITYTSLEDLFEDDLVKRFEDGQVMTLVDLICRKLRKGKDIAHIADDLEEEVSVVEAICNAASEFAPDYDEKKVFEKIMEKKQVNT